ncbi:putative CyP450 monooxygenase [Panaeolus papilionaceus]|nr:putative CyP450 monooxygenase [Panaeolus papilionaceus]
MIFYSVMGMNFLILNSSKRTNDLFDERSANYSDRIRMPMLVELMNWRYNFAFMSYGPEWRKHRKAFHEHFNQAVIDRYDDIQLTEIRKFLGRLLEAPDNFMHHIRFVFAAIIMEAVYGIKIKDSDDDPHVATITAALEGLAKAGVPGSYLVDHLPMLKYYPGWLPGGGFQQVAEESCEATRRYVVETFNQVKESIRSGTYRPCVVGSIIEDVPEDGKGDNTSERKEAERIAQDIGAIAYVAGADTTASAVQAFFLAMAMYPEAQKKAQAEIDSVIGNDRLPEFQDRPSLPYVEAVVKETMRWHQIVPFAIAHMSAEDDEYDGYFIPKGTVVMGNAWSILHDPAVFKDPSIFNPDRYFENPNLLNPHTAAFGYGRRICPGRFFSDHNLFAIIASVLAVFDITPSVDNGGNTIPLEYEPSSGFISYPAPFACRIVSRTAGSQQLIIENQPSQDL